MAQTTLNVRMDENVKKALEEFCISVGMNTSVAVNMFAKAVIREQRLPFDIVADPFYSNANKEHLRRSLEQIERGSIVVKTMDELEAMATDE
ncbi:MAG: type II toxin-antitoxin system RelB/DinJ family antitoxin [Oscillospiraceae bacterium]|nr:type II toxin-antitoxin system RelB/DinJ family antitoxin [Oscillospiraceae bacterium]